MITIIGGDDLRVDSISIELAGKLEERTKRTLSTSLL